MTSSSQSIPASMKAWVAEAPGAGAVIKQVPTPEVQPGTVVAKVLSTFIYQSRRDTLKATGKAPYFTNPYPYIPGSHAVVRVAATGPDTTAFSVGQLAIVDIFVTARDDRTGVQILWGTFDGGSPASKKFAADNWRNGHYAEYVRVPLENIHPLDEARLCGSPSAGGLGYSIPELVVIPSLAVIEAGYRRVNLRAGETVVISPATGHYSVAAVALADAIGANIIALSRNGERLQKIKEFFPRIKTLQPTGDVKQDTEAIKKLANGPVDVVADVSSPAMVGSTHIASCMAAVKNYGRICLLGGRGDPSLPISYRDVVFRNLKIEGSYMFQWEDVRSVIKMVETGVLKLGKDSIFPVVAEFSIDNLEQAVAKIETDPGLGNLVVLNP
ncbi:NAD(P)-binding protein [Canariomyces notabilis]|uniref:NAD(P)-binding protein n=1 Tax=Canariomyces notabilis TaxID=2074819 RepID=A0AAN6TFM0_9PEZI|nr:NAD(P)-binding protein [Canariomyces arenarius]